jgi:hypothetical protein
MTAAIVVARHPLQTVETAPAGDQTLSQGDIAEIHALLAARDSAPV